MERGKKKAEGEPSRRSLGDGWKKGTPKIKERGGSDAGGKESGRKNRYVKGCWEIIRSERSTLY